MLLKVIMRSPNAAFSVIRHLIGSSSRYVELDQLEQHHPCAEKLWSCPSIHCPLDRFQSIDLAFYLTIALGQIDGVTDSVDIPAVDSDDLPDGVPIRNRTRFRELTGRDSDLIPDSFST